LFTKIKSLTEQSNALEGQQLLSLSNQNSKRIKCEGGITHAEKKQKRNSSRGDDADPLLTPAGRKPAARPPSNVNKQVDQIRCCASAGHRQQHGGEQITTIQRNLPVAKVTMVESSRTTSQRGAIEESLKDRKFQVSTDDPQSLG